MIVASLLAAAVALVAGASPASAQYGTQNFVTCTPTSASVGQTVTCRAGYFDAGTTVTWVLNSDPVNLGSSTVAGDGIATLTFAVPAGTTAGAHTVSASGLLQGAGQTIQTVSAAITVVGATGAGAVPGGTTGAGLPVTGSNNVGLYAGVAAVLIAGGGIALTASRRQRSSTSVR